MTLEGLGEMFEGYSAEMCVGKFPLMSMGGRAEGLVCADPGARTPIGVSGISSVYATTIWMVLHTQADSHLSTKLTLDGYTLDQIKETKLLGVRIQDDLKWSRNTTEEQ